MELWGGHDNMTKLEVKVFPFNWFKRKPKKVRVYIKFVPYDIANDLIKNGWTLAKEEDRNHCIGWAWVELLQEEKKQ
jgi:hypothetical protein